MNSDAKQSEDEAETAPSEPELLPPVSAFAPPLVGPSARAPARPSILWRARVPLAIAAFFLAGALIRYPRYVTRECFVLPGAHAEVRAEEPGIIAEILAKEGALVSASDVVVVLDTHDVDAAIADARADLTRRQADVERLRRGARPEEIAWAQSAVNAKSQTAVFAGRELARQKRLLAQGLTSAQKRDEAARNHELALATLAQARAELRLVRAGARAQDIAVAEADLAAAQALLDHYERRRGRLTIRAPIGGRITTPKLQERIHAHVARGSIVFEIADTRRVEVEIHVPEHEVDLIAFGQRTVVRARGLPLEPFEGKLTFIAPVAEEHRGARVVRAIAEVANPQALLQPGMSGYGEIDTGRVPLLELAGRRVVRWLRVRFLL